jgi:hypothetical protein
LNDLTEARPVTETVTAEQVFQAGRDKEREAVVAFINRETAGMDEDTRFMVQGIVGAIKAGGHRLVLA